MNPASTTADVAAPTAKTVGSLDSARKRVKKMNPTAASSRPVLFSGLRVDAVRPQLGGGGQGRRAVLRLADHVEPLGLQEHARGGAEARVVVDDQNGHVLQIVADGEVERHTANRTLSALLAAGGGSRRPPAQGRRGGRIPECGCQASRGADIRNA